jgi:hypothetical protein
MLLFRWAMLFLLLGSAVCFAYYAGTGQVRFKRYGFVVLKWALIAALVFLGVLALERLL